MLFLLASLTLTTFAATHGHGHGHNVTHNGNNGTSSSTPGYNLTALQEFCSTRPQGLYCFSDTHKVECPSLTTYTCPGGDSETCQERGILREFGFRGGIARCVPRLNQTEVKEFCSVRQPGVYCWGQKSEFELNIKIQCPTGLVFKCATVPTPDFLCLQKYEKYAVCAGMENSNGTTTCPPIIRFVTVTETVTEAYTHNAVCSKTKAHTGVVAQTISKAIHGGGTVIKGNTEVGVIHKTLVEDVATTSAWATTSTYGWTSTFEPEVFTSTLVDVVVTQAASLEGQ